MTNRVALKAKSPSNAKIRRCVKFAAFLTSGNGVRGMIKILNNILTVPLKLTASNEKSKVPGKHARAGQLLYRPILVPNGPTSQFTELIAAFNFLSYPVYYIFFFLFLSESTGFILNYL